MSILKSVVIAVVSVVVLASCGVAVKRCEEPQLNLPSAFVKDQLDSLTLADMNWWEFYGDEVLGKFITHALENNKDLLAAAAKVEQMRLGNRISQSAMYPKLGASVMADYEVENYTDKGHTQTPQFDLKWDLSWEIDLWGNLRWANQKTAADTPPVND